MSAYIPGQPLYFPKQSFVLGKLRAGRCPSGKLRGATAAAAGIWALVYWDFIGIMDNGKENGNYLGLGMRV